MTLLKMHLLGVKPLTGDALKAADLDSNDSIDALDYVELRKNILSQS
ncbi:MAG: dockerin type I domain-containing protein [Ruminiclostridium sp.]